MPPKYFCHLLAVWWATSRSVDYFGRLAKVCRSHDRRTDNDELLRIPTAKVVKAVYRAPRYAQRLARANLDGDAVNSPCKYTLYAIEDFLIGVIFVGRRRKLLSCGGEELEYRYTVIRIIARD
jgi:hypothetical protein